MSKIIKSSGGDSVSFSKLSMEAFHSTQQIEEMEKQRLDIVESGRVQAAGMIEQAEKDAAEIYEKAEKEAEQIKQKAMEDGLAQGRELAREQVEAEFSDVVKAIQSVKDMIDAHVETIFRSIEQQTLDLVLAIAKKIVGYEISVNKKVVVDLISRCLSMTKEKNHITIKVNPADFEIVEEKKDYFLRKVRGLRGVDVEESEAVFEGGCIVETSAGDINADIEEQFLKIRETLAG